MKYKQNKITDYYFVKIKKNIKSKIKKKKFNNKLLDIIETISLKLNIN